jgi:uncharacterized membrane protein YbaN (DUF454 family)
VTGTSIPVPDAAAPTLGFSVVHSSRGRLRVHLPDPDGRIVTRLRAVPGVTDATANEVTGNVLILFDPQQTSEQALLAELEDGYRTSPALAPFQAPAGELLAVAAECIDDLPAGSILVFPEGGEPAEPGGYVTGRWRTVYKVLGWSSVGMAGVGAALPGIPTAPFVVLAGYFFVRSSPEAHAWLRRSRWFGTILRDWEERRGVRRSVKYTALGLMAAGFTVTAVIGLPLALIATIAALEVVGAVIVLRLPEIDEPAPSSAAPAAL